MTDRLDEALPGCGHWKDADFARSWSLRLMDEDADWRMVCEAVIDTASGQRYCMDEGPRLEPAEIEGWFAAARSWHTLTNPTDELIERVADLAGERNGFWQIPPVAAAYIAASVDALSVTPTPEETR